MSDEAIPAAEPPRSAATIAAAYGIATDPTFGAVAPPLYLSSTYAFEGFDRPRRFDYGRSGNPSRELLGEALARLEGGVGAVVTSSGMAAVDLVLTQCKPGDVVVAPHDCYGGTHRLLNARAERNQLVVRFVDQTNDDTFVCAMAERPSLVMIETPSNPLMRVVDVAQLARVAKAAGARVAVDNTFLSPALQRPLALGADYVIHSTTKYLNGHSDVIGGAVVAADPEEVERMQAWANVVGTIGAPFDSWLTLRGLRTLFPRIERQQRTAAVIAQYLQDHDAVSAVHYPGLPSDPYNAVASRQQSGFGAMLSFELRGGVQAVRDFIAAVETFVLAESLGGIESLVSHPATMTHVDMGVDARRAAGISDGLVRLSIGLEGEADLLAGLEAGLRAVR